ncbi:DUF2971 domain-containing protein [Vibrio sp. Y159]|uniref:DUF2971 domain-containing protein n=1 Tax=Vibrio sp. Y159 TaxID=3074703 RepID=UPI0029650D78|nr:DUF2971 domain-containing protein [Vibrio sp. Y159]MDW1533314.1 DUF2971 domain-containing protein [Vibrio sp. Y159]
MQQNKLIAMYMITSLYKYFPARPVFFGNFLIRATTGRALNDPFEVNPSDDYWVDLFMVLDRELSREEVQNKLSVMIELEQREYDFGIDLYKRYGIVSLTETRDNLLMWSHYADEHKGFVVEFDITHDFFTKMHSDGNDMVGEVSRVYYRKQRTNKLSNYLEPYFVKSDEWQYEKEHRLLLPINKADRYLISNQNDLEDILEYYPNAVIDNETSKNSSLKAINNSEGPGLSCEYPSVMCMFKVPKEAIKSITFGCNCPIAIITEIKGKLYEQGLEDVTLYRALRDSSDFKLNFNEVDD